MNEGWMFYSYKVIKCHFGSLLLYGAQTNVAFLNKANRITWLQLRWIHFSDYLFPRSLESLDLSHNRLTFIPANLPRFLHKLILEHNSIRHIPAFTFRHMRASLHSLYLSHNELSTEGLERHSFVGTYRSMRELLLDNNRLQDIPRSVRQFKNLQVLRLEYNQIR